MEEDFITTVCVCVQEGSLSVWKHDAVGMVKYLNYGSKSQVKFRTNSGHFVGKTLNPSDHS